MYCVHTAYIKINYIYDSSGELQTAENERKKEIETET